MKFILPKPPSVNHLYGRHGWRTYITPKGVAWFEEAGWIIKTTWKNPTIINNVTIDIKLYYCGRYDYDNCLKATNDILTKQQVIKDDSQIIDARIRKYKVPHRDEEKIEVEITPCSS